RVCGKSSENTRAGDAHHYTALQGRLDFCRQVIDRWPERKDNAAVLDLPRETPSPNRQSGRAIFFTLLRLRGTLHETYLLYLPVSVFDHICRSPSARPN